MSAVNYRDQKRESCPLDMELQAVFTWGMELKSSIKEARSLNHLAISSTPSYILFKD